MKEFTIKTRERIEFVDITDNVQKAVDIENGICLVFATHATCAIFLNEYEPRIVKDYRTILETIVPPKNYYHNQIDDNADSHLRSALIGQGKTIPVRNSKLHLGTWQRIILVELDGPRSRNVVVQTVRA